MWGGGGAGGWDSGVAQQTTHLHMGYVQVWDRRRGEHPVKQLPCHNGPVYCCAWHPEREHHILTAGRDKMIKVKSHSALESV